MIQVISRPYSINWSGNSIWYSFKSEAAVADLSIRFEVRIQFKRTDELAYRPLITVPLIPDLSGVAHIDIHTVLHSELDFDLPNLGGDLSVTRGKKQSGRFYIQFREISNVSNNGGFSDSEVQHILRVVKGGVPDFGFNNNVYWSNLHKKTRPFFTWQMNNRLASFTEPLYLCFMPAAEITSTDFKVRITVNFADFSQAVKEFPFVLALDEIGYIPVGASRLQLQLLSPPRKIWFWTVQVLDAESPSGEETVSEIFSFELDNRPSSKEISLLYRGSTGGLDTVRIRGVVEQKNDYTFQEFGRARQPAYLNQISPSATRLATQASELVTYAGDIGHLKKEEQDRLRDIFFQREVYILRNGRYFPVVVSIKSIAQRKSTDKRWSLPIEFSLATEGEEYFAADSFYDLVYEAQEEVAGSIVEVNTCEAVITNLVASPSPLDANTAKATFDYNVTGSVKKVQYLVVGFTNWIETPYPYSAPLELTFARGTYTEVKFRAICTNGVVGNEASVFVNTVFSSGNGGVRANSRITNNSASIFNYRIRVNNQVITAGKLSAGDFETFLCLSATNARIDIEVSWYMPSIVRLIAGGSEFLPDEVQGSLHIFNRVPITNGIQFTIK